MVRRCCAAVQFGRGAARDWGPSLHWLTGPSSSVAPGDGGRSEAAAPSKGEGDPLLPTLVSCRPLPATQPPCTQRSSSQEDRETDRRLSNGAG